ncbi:MAG: MerR family transcriptional regulator [Chitinophaga sp.]|uniref:MerR family transcriptional regulator n=1 Tax=Chitinophaga sp. TaxID=1869181 RepID=UPI001B2B4AC8|nr:MerR family transcriptional regulator [Chitinophaga sp.]MBO9733184.1 MerR family transcriptional regulator [Chitinophaga sp.]
MDNYSVKKLSRLAGVSVRTLHLYDKMDLLKPSVRTNAGYRLYGEKELLRLQQILFYRELDFPLKEICIILDDPAFDLMQALEAHKAALLARKERINTLIGTIEKTLVTLKNNTMLHAEDLYEGIPQDKITAHRTAAISQWGDATIASVENNLRALGKDEMAAIQTALNNLTAQLLALMPEGPDNPAVQQCIEQRQELVDRLIGGKPEAGKLDYLRKMAELHTAGNAAIAPDGLPGREIAVFISEATGYYLRKKG